MALFNFSKQKNALEDFSCNITLKELAERFKSLYREVELLDEVTIRIDCFHADLRHQAGTPYFTVESSIAIPENMIPSDDDLCNYCREMNEQLQVKVTSHKFEDATVLFFKYFVPNLNKMNIADINQIFMWLMAGTNYGWNEFEKRFHKGEHENKKSSDETDETKKLNYKEL